MEPQYTVVQESVDRTASKEATPVWRWYYSGPFQQSAAEEESLLPERVECLVFVVHGIGQFHKWAGESPIAFFKDVGKVRNNGVRRLLERTEGDMPVPGRLEFLPLEWFTSIHVDSGIGNRLKEITLPNIPAVRDFANFAIADLMVYQDDEWRERLLSELQQKMDSVYETFCKRTPDFTGHVAILGHSLGSVIMFDLLQRRLGEHTAGFLAGSERAVPAQEAPEKPLRCPVPRCFFGAGSPLGMFLSIRLSKKGQRVPQYFQGLDVRWPVSQAGLGWRFFNIFHPHDPVAYRIEPLLNSAYAAMEPRLVPCRGGLRLHHAVAQWWKGTEEKAGDDGEELSKDVLRVHTKDITKPIVHQVSLDLTGASAGDSVTMDRLDYALQESTVESMSEMVSALSSHFMYWESDDFAAFIVDQVLDSLAAKQEQDGR